MRFRQLIPMTHEEYLNEPRHNVRFFLAVNELDSEIQQEEAKS
jgi:hypothetical protein